MDRPDHVEAYRRMRALLRRAGLTLTGLQSQLDQAGYSYSYDAITSWGRSKRGFPHNPQLLATIARILASQLPSAPQTVREIGLFLRAAGYSATQLHTLEDVLDYGALAATYAEGPHLLLPSKIPSPASLAAGSRPPPFAAAPGFCGRDALLSEIAARLSQGIDVVLSGIDGSGKTMLAAEFGYRYGRFFSGGLFWLNADSPTAFWHEVAACGGHEGMALLRCFEHLPPATQQRMVLARWADPAPRLIILDNLNDAELIDHVRQAESNCRLLISSQLASLDPALNVQILTVPPLLRKDSIALLRSEVASLPISDAELDAIARAASDVPLALHLAGKLLAREGLHTAEHIKAALTDPALEPQQLNPSPSGDNPFIATIIQRSIMQLEPDEPSDALARFLLVCMAHCAPGAPLESDLLLAMAGPAPDANTIGANERLALPPVPRRARRGLQSLIDLSLLERGSGTNLRLHRLVAAVARELPEARAARTQAETCILLAARQRQERPAQLRILLPHIAHLVQQAETRRDRLAHLLRIDLGWYLALLHHHDAARQQLREALAILSSQHGHDHPDTVEARSRLGLCYQLAGEMRLALPIWQTMLASIGRRITAESDSLARELTNAGSYFLAYGDLRRAEALLYEALTLQRRKLPLYHESIGQTLRNLALLHLHGGRLRNARRYALLALAIVEQRQLQQSLAHTDACQVLGEIFLELGNWPLAEQYMQRAIAGYATLFAGPETSPHEVLHAAMANGLRLLALIAIERGQHAANYLDAALHIAQLTAGEQGYPTALIQRELARVDLAEARYLSALDRCDTALAVLGSRVADDHIETARTLHLRGCIETAYGRPAKAQHTLSTALAMQRRLSSRPHPLAGRILQSMGEQALLAGNLDQARQHWQDALRELRATIPRHPATTACERRLLKL